MRMVDPHREAGQQEGEVGSRPEGVQEEQLGAQLEDDQHQDSLQEEREVSSHRLYFQRLLWVILAR